MRLWIALFVYAASVAAAVQLVVLPELLPTWHAGDGLAVGGDWVYFHRLAVSLAQQIRASGWSAWELRPEGQAPAGIAAAVYALTVQQPWTIIPVSAALFATACLTLLQIVRALAPSWRVAALCSLPFALYPSAMLLYAQIHKDVYAGAGVLLFLCGLVSMVRAVPWQAGATRLLGPILCLLGGMVLVWVVRPYEVLMMQGVVVVLAPVIVALHLWRGRRGILSWRRAVLAVLVTCVVPLAMGPFTQEPLPARGSAVPSPPPVAAPTQVPTVESPPSVAEEALALVARAVAPVERKAETLAVLRNQFLDAYGDSAALIDGNVRLRAGQDVVGYLPRAAEIALLAPFPDQWLAAGSLQPNTLMRRVSALEMIGVYLSLPFALYALIRWRRRIEIWVIWGFCLGMMLVYAVATPNVGSLYRARYPFLMTLVAVGLAALSAFLAGLNGRRLPSSEAASNAVDATEDRA